MLSDRKRREIKQKPAPAKPQRKMHTLHQTQAKRKLLNFIP